MVTYFILGIGHSVPHEHYKPHAEESREYREKYIRLKHKDRAFHEDNAQKDAHGRKVRKPPIQKGASFRGAGSLVNSFQLPFYLLLHMDL